jgi:hypothetical protein
MPRFAYWLKRLRVARKLICLIIPYVILLERTIRMQSVNVGSAQFIAASKSYGESDGPIGAKRLQDRGA